MVVVGAVTFPFGDEGLLLGVVVFDPEFADGLIAFDVWIGEVGECHCGMNL